MTLRVNSGSPFPGGQPKPTFTQQPNQPAGRTTGSVFSGKASNLNGVSIGPSMLAAAAQRSPFVGGIAPSSPFVGGSPLPTFTQTQEYSPSGAATLLGLLKTAGSNIATNVGGANSRIWGWLTGKPQQSPSQPAPAAAPNNQSANSPYYYEPDPNYQPSQDQQQQDYPAFQGNWADYLAQAQKVTGSNIANQLAALAASRDQINQGYQVGDSQLAAMYQALHDQTAQDNAAAAARYAEAQKAVQAQTDQAQQALSGANASVANSQDLTNANLGNKLVNPNGGLSIAQQAQLDAAQANNSRLQQQGQSAYDSMVSGAQAQNTYGTAMGNAAQFAGADRRAQLKNALLSALASVAQQEAQLKDSQGQQATSLASTMFNNDYNAWKDNRDYQASRSDEAWKQAYQQQQLDDNAARYQMQYGNNGAGSNSKGPNAALDWLQNSAGLDANTSSQITQQIMASIAAGQGAVTGGGGSKTAYQAGMDAVNAMDPSVKGAAMMALYQITGGF